MEKAELEELRGKVACGAVLETAGFAVDLKESTRRAVKYRRGDEIIIVIHDGQGWFDPLLAYRAEGTSEWGTKRRHAGELLADALNSRIPQIFDTIRDGDSERRVLNVIDTEAAKEKLTKIKIAFQTWVWSDPDRTDRLARVYNDTFNNIAPRSFDGDHLQLPGASGAFVLYGHQKRGIWLSLSS